MTRKLIKTKADETRLSNNKKIGNFIQGKICYPNSKLRSA